MRRAVDRRNKIALIYQRADGVNSQRIDWEKKRMNDETL